MLSNKKFIIYAAVCSAAGAFVSADVPIYIYIVNRIFSIGVIRMIASIRESR
jgi:hypothetical protein